MLEIIVDICGWYDILGGVCVIESNIVCYDLEKCCMYVCCDSWMLVVNEYEEFGFGKWDIIYNINFFMNVLVIVDGGFIFEDGIFVLGKYVELKVLMNIIVLIFNCL